MLPEDRQVTFPLSLSADSKEMRKEVLDDSSGGHALISTSPHMIEGGLLQRGNFRGWKTPIPDERLKIDHTIFEFFYWLFDGVRSFLECQF
jgi:hypothetical protein